MIPAERLELLRIARESIAAALEGRAYVPCAATEAAAGAGGAFVTLHQDGALRGCIGQIEPGEGLADVIAHCAVSAALRDPRFAPLTLRDLARGTDIEISVLTPMQPVADVNEIDVGRDGILIRQGTQSGLLLPQVATEWGWDRAAFLAQACRKAGLSADAWTRGAEIYRFEAEVFSEGTEGSPQDA